MSVPLITGQLPGLNVTCDGESQILNPLPLPGISVENNEDCLTDNLTSLPGIQVQNDTCDEDGPLSTSDVVIYDGDDLTNIDATAGAWDNLSLNDVFAKINNAWVVGGGVTSITIASANGFAGTSSGGATPALTISTTITGILKGNGTAMSAAVGGTDYLVPNVAIVAATKTKITYDVRGLVTAGADATTTDIAEGVNLYYTNARGIGSVLTGYVSGAGVVAATDTILQAIEKLNGNIGAIVSGVSSVSGTANRITSSGGANPVINIAAAYDALWQPIDATLTAVAGLTITANSLIYGTGTDAFAVLAQNTTGTRKFLREVSSSAPVWDTLVAGDIPSLSGSYLTIDGATVGATTQAQQFTNGITTSAITEIAGNGITVNVTGATGFTVTGLKVGLVMNDSAQTYTMYTDIAGLRGWEINSGGALYPLSDGNDIGITGTNRIGTIFMSSNIDYVTNMNFTVGGVNKLVIDNTGKVTTGVWEATLVGIAFGGTGLNSTGANTVFAGPTTGAPAAPSWRLLVANDIPNITEGFLTLSDNTLNDVSNAAHGFFPKLIANRVYYVDNVGALVPLALGAAATVLTSNGATSPPTFSAAGGGGSQTPWTSDISADGFVLYGNDGSGETLTIASTSHATKGFTYIGASTKFAFDEVNSRMGVVQAAPTSRLHLNFNVNGVTQADANGILLANSSAATVGLQSISPPLIWQGNGWKTNATAASQDVRFRADVLPVQGAATPTARWNLAASINAGAYSDVFTITNAGVIITSHSFSSTAGFSSQVRFGGTAGSVNYRTTNGGSNLTSDLFQGVVSNSAGIIGILLDQTNQLVFTAANGTRPIARAGIAIINLVNTAASESADLAFYSQAGGAAMVNNMTLFSAGKLGVKAGASAAVTAMVGGKIFNTSTTTGTPASSAETDLHAYTILASTFSADNSGIEGKFTGQFAANATTKQVRVYFGGTLIFDTGALAFNSGDWEVEVFVQRVSSTVVRCSAKYNSSNATLATYEKYTEITGLTLTNSQVFKITGTAGIGAAASDITCVLSKVIYEAAA